MGWGEGVPRDYVTGESPETCFREFEQRGRDLLNCRAEDPQELVSWLGEHAPAGLRVSVNAEESEAEPPPAASRYLPHAYWCASELAVLDAFGRSLGFPLSEAVRCVVPTELVQPKQFVQYTAVLSGSQVWRECLVAGAMLLAGFHDFKAKVGFEPQADVKKVRWLRRTLGGNDLRLDANGAWSPVDAAWVLEEIAPCKPSCIEQPLSPGQEDRLPALSQLGIPVMLDESVRSVSEAREALARGWCELVNVRISKCGGLLASARVAAAVEEAGGRAQLGCLVGETGLLSAAGRHLACALGRLEHVEGSYDRFLLSVQLTEPDITFGSGGWARLLPGPGLGVVVRPRVLERFTVRHSSVPW